MIYLREVDPNRQDDLRSYLGLLRTAEQDQGVATHLPEILEEQTEADVIEAMTQYDALRYLIYSDNFSNQAVGRVELTRKLNDDCSIVERKPEGLELGYNTCYFALQSFIESLPDQDRAHQTMARLAIEQAFKRGDWADGLSPWLPVSADGTDVSRGWRLLVNNPLPGYQVLGNDEPTQDGFFPQFGIGENRYNFMRAIPLSMPEANSARTEKGSISVPVGMAGEVSEKAAAGEYSHPHRSMDTPDYIATENRLIDAAHELLNGRAKKAECIEVGQILKGDFSEQLVQLAKAATRDGIYSGKSETDVRVELVDLLSLAAMRVSVLASGFFPCRAGAF